MKLRNLILSLLSIVSFNQVIISKVEITDQQIIDLLVQLNKEYAEYESTKPQKGYCVTIQTNPSLQAKLTPYGGVRSTKSLSGMPENEANYVRTCPFCQYSQQNYIDPKIVKNFNDGTYAVTSLSNQVLIIPQEHYSHLFTTPSEMQVKILKNIVSIRDEHADKVQGPIEFHCGSAAGQTVFHLHGRTGVYIK